MNEYRVCNRFTDPRGEIENRGTALTNARKLWRNLLGCAGTATVLGATNANGQPTREPWFFSAAEIGAAYQYQESCGGRIPNPLPAFSCMTGKADFAATSAGLGWVGILLIASAMAMAPWALGVLIAKGRGEPVVVVTQSHPAKHPVTGAVTTKSQTDRVSFESPLAATSIAGYMNTVPYSIVADKCVNRFGELKGGKAAISRR